MRTVNVGQQTHLLLRDESTTYASTFTTPCGRVSPSIYALSRPRFGEPLSCDSCRAYVLASLPIEEG